MELETERLFCSWLGGEMEWPPVGALSVIASAEDAYGQPGLYLYEPNPKKQNDNTRRLDDKFGLNFNNILFSDAKFSPDGQKILFIYCRDESLVGGGTEQINTLATANLDGTGFQLLEENKAMFLSPCFSPEGHRAFYFFQEKEERVLLRSYDFTTGEKSDIAILPEYWHGLQETGLLYAALRISWSKDGLLVLTGGNQDGL